MTTRGQEAPGIYVHVPFCSRICPYCDFAVTTPGGGRRERYLPALLAEIEIAGEDPWRGAETPGRADTVYFGGGTPSLLERDEMLAVLARLDASIELSDDPWLGLEANPEDVTPDRLRAWRDSGVRFLSLGVQSFRDPDLQFLGRRHTADEARAAVDQALAADIETVSVDLIYGLPDQPLEAWAEQLQIAVAAGPQHLSCYQLTVESGTPFEVMRRRGRLHELPDASQAELFLLTHLRLADHGFASYEVSNFALSAAHRSRHNPKYWRHVPYLGLGPSAHSFDGRRRWWNHRHLTGWAAAIDQQHRPVDAEEELMPAQLALEELMLGLRTAEGIDLAGFRRRHGCDLLTANRETCEEFASRGLLLTEAGRLTATPSGLAVVDALVRGFVIDP
jgi:oxygen-independent coproporphyrinogen-3 oxidase